MLSSENKELICKLEKSINSDHNVLLINDSILSVMGIDVLLESIGGNYEIWVDEYCKYNDDRIKVISRKEFEFIENLKNMYDFSEKVEILSDSSCYPQIMSYISNGIMTKEEVFKALLFNIG